MNDFTTLVSARSGDDPNEEYKYHFITVDLTQRETTYRVVIKEVNGDPNNQCDNLVTVSSRSNDWQAALWESVARAEVIGMDKPRLMRAANDAEEKYYNELDNEPPKPPPTYKEFNDVMKGLRGEPTYNEPATKPAKGMTLGMFG